MDEDVELPAYYIAARNTPLEHARFIADALGITPISVVVISDVADMELATQMNSPVLRTWSPEEALELAMAICDTDRPLVIGDAVLLDAVYRDGRKETVPIHVGYSKP